MSAGPITVADVFRWQRQVTRDSSLSAETRLVGIVISHHVNGQTGLAWPSQPTLAALSGSHNRTVQRATTALLNAGHLAVDVNRGRNRTNHYRLILKNAADEASTFAADNTAVVSSFDADNTTPAPRLDSNKHDTSAVFIPENTAASTENTAASTLKHDTSAVQTTYELQNELKREGERATKSAPHGALVVVSGGGLVRQEADDFSVFWSLCPKQEGERFARVAWDSALKRAKPQAIIDGMRRYSVSRRGKEHRFHKRPDRWLEGDHWNDVVKDDGEASKGARVRGKPSYLDIAEQHVRIMEGK